MNLSLDWKNITIVKYKTDDLITRTLVSDYLALDGSGKFVNTIKVLCLKYNLTQWAIFKKMKGNFIARDRSCYCNLCHGEMDGYTDRKLLFKEEPIYRCDQCEGELKKIRDELIEDSLRTAFDRQIFHSLTPCHMEIFKTLVRNFGFTAAVAKEFGMSQTKLTSLLRAFAKKDLIYFDGNVDYVRIFADYLKLFWHDTRALDAKKKFLSQNNRELYRQLKSDNAYVFPEASLAAFINIDRIEHVFTQKWHRNYLLKARVDCLVCDEDGMPNFACEYQGSAHDEAEQMRRDAVKKSALEAAKIPLYYYKYDPVSKSIVKIN